MAVFTKEYLSAAPTGRPTKVVAVATPGTLIHTAHATAKDEIHIYAVNRDVAIDTFLTIEFGGTLVDDHVRVQIKADKGLILVIPGCLLTGGLTVRAFADNANIVNIVGWVNRIS